VFVDPSRADRQPGSGTKEDPFASINGGIMAVAEGNARRVYVLESETSDSVEVDVEGVTLHGGLRSDWTYRAEGRTRVKQPIGDEDVAVWIVEPVAGEVTIRGFIIEGKETTLPGESSIALVVEGAVALLSRVEVIAHDGSAGAAGSTPDEDIGPQGLDPALAGNPGLAPPIQSTTAGGTGGNGGENRRPGCVSQGGRGGTGASALGVGSDYAAGDGQPGVSDGVQTALGGNGAEVDEGVFTNCQGGAGAFSALPSTAGENGASANGFGSLSADGFVPASATAGERGLVGSAGGGGGGGRRQPQRGYGGAGGGAGGCGGWGGTPGQSGGSSIGIAALGATLVFEGPVTISTGAGGDGGNGSAGQEGALGGLGGLSSGQSQACSGGAGRQGGTGGFGGAGSGGHSLGVAHEGTRIVGSAAISISAAGERGLAANPATGEANGGLSVAIYQF
jgi:hypothetical protein